MPPMDRETLLRGAGVSPLVPTLEPIGALTRPPMRLVCAGNPVGMPPKAFFPEEIGGEYAMAPLLKPLEHHRKRFTVFSHLDHPVPGGHLGVHSFLSRCKNQDAAQWADRNISIDQRTGGFVGSQTRFPSLVAVVGQDLGDMACRMSLTCNGFDSPPVTSSRDLFARLFVVVADDARIRGANDCDLNAVDATATDFRQHLRMTDQRKLDEYLTSVREVERCASMAFGWVDHRKSRVAMRPPRDGPFTESLDDSFGLMALVIETDSTRVDPPEMPRVIDPQNLGSSGDCHGSCATARPKCCNAACSRSNGFRPGYMPGSSPGSLRWRNPTERRCSTARWSGSAAAWAAAVRIRTRACRSWWRLPPRRAQTVTDRPPRTAVQSLRNRVAALWRGSRRAQEGLHDHRELCMAGRTGSFASVCFVAVSAPAQVIRHFLDDTLWTLTASGATVPKPRLLTEASRPSAPA